MSLENRFPVERTVQIKATEQRFHVPPFILLLKIAEIAKTCEHSSEIIENTFFFVMYLFGE